MIYTITIVHSYLADGVDESDLIVAVPQNSGSKVPIISWERGQEILPGALEAVNHINRDQSGILSLVLADRGSLLRSESVAKNCFSHPF